MRFEYSEGYDYNYFRLTCDSLTAATYNIKTCVQQVLQRSNRKTVNSTYRNERRRRVVYDREYNIIISAVRWSDCSSVRENVVNGPVAWDSRTLLRFDLVILSASSAEGFSLFFLLFKRDCLIVFERLFTRMTGGGRAGSAPQRRERIRSESIGRTGDDDGFRS